MTAISKEEFRNEKLYQTIMHIARKMLDEDIISEEENIWTFDSKGELFITIMSSLPQEESRSISENVTWGQRKRMADGKVSFAYSRFLGLDKDKETGKIVVNPGQAKTVRLIFHLFLDGMAAISAKEAQNGRLANFIEVLKAQDGTITEFDEQPWGSMVGVRHSRQEEGNHGHFPGWDGDNGVKIQ